MTKSIVLEVCRELRIHPVEFFGPGKDRRLVGARRLAIHRLQLAGFSAAAVARMIRRSYSTVKYWDKPAYRKHQSEYFKIYNAKRRTEMRA